MLQVCLDYTYHAMLTFAQRTNDTHRINYGNYLGLSTMVIICKLYINYDKYV